MMRAVLALWRRWRSRRAMTAPPAAGSHVHTYAPPMGAHFDPFRDRSI